MSVKDLLISGEDYEPCQVPRPVSFKLNLNIAILIIHFRDHRNDPNPPPVLVIAEQNPVPWLQTLKHHNICNMFMIVKKFAQVGLNWNHVTPPITNSTQKESFRYFHDFPRIFKILIIKNFRQILTCGRRNAPNLTGIFKWLYIEEKRDSMHRIPILTSPKPTERIFTGNNFTFIRISCIGSFVIRLYLIKFINVIGFLHL